MASWSPPADYCSPSDADVFDSGTLRSRNSYGSLGSRKNTLRSGFSSLRKSAKKIFRSKHRDTPEAEYAECKGGDGGAPFLPAPRQASESFRVSVAEVAARFEDDFAGAPHTDPYAFAAPAEPAPFEITPAPAPAPEFEPALTPQYTDAAPCPPPELYPSLIAAGAPPSPPPSPPPPPPPPPSPPPKSAHEASDFEHTRDDFAAQPVTFLTPAPYTQYLHGAVTFLKSAILAVASAGVYVVALPWACIVLGLRGFRGGR